MQEIMMYALYDRAAEVYDTPVFFLNEATAKRWFYTLNQKGEGRFEYFAKDMELHQIARFNVLTGKVGEMAKIILTGIQIGKEIEKNEKRNEAQVQ